MKRYITGGVLLVVVTAITWAASVTTVPTSARIYDVFEITATSPTYVRTVPITGRETMLIDVHSHDAPIDVLIKDPSGEALSQLDMVTLAIAEPDIPPLGAVLFADGWHVQARVAQPEEGNWTIEVALPLGGLPTTGTITTILEGGVGLGAVVSRPFYYVGQAVTIGVVAFDGSLPYQAESLTAYVYKEGNALSPQELTVRDDGLFPDMVSGDGLFTAAAEGLEEGHYIVEAFLDLGPANAQAGADFIVTEILGEITGNVADEGVDTNGDGLVEEVRLNVELDVQTPGTYDLVGTLALNDGKKVVAGARAILGLGLSSVAIPFKAQDIRAYLDSEGPFEIEEIRLIKLAEDMISADRLADEKRKLGTTDVYLLQRPTTIILQGIVEEPIDIDGNGLFDLLNVNMQVDTLAGGDFTWSGNIQALSGVMLSVASVRGSLIAGLNTIGLTFEGTDIGAMGIDGPYIVRDVAIYGPPGAAAVSDEVGRTVPYTASQFEGYIPPVTNQPPVANAGEDQMRECISSEGATVTLDGTGSEDPDGDVLMFKWTGPFGLLTGEVVTTTLPLGVHLITLTVDDGNGGTDSDDVVVSVNDAVAPNIEVTVDPDVLWPANHKMVPITATVTAADVCDASPAVSLVSITASEGDNVLGDGNTSDDIQGAEIGTDDRAFSLRAERSGTGTGRIYTVTYAATDASGNTANASATVTVPHNK
jgi:hypothetical protein